MTLFSDEPRNRELRSYVLQQFVSSVMTDDERARLWGLPAGCRMREGAKILSPERLVCGEHVFVGEGAILDASGGLEIGAHTSIGAGVFVWSHTSFLANLTFANQPGSERILRAATAIGAGCFVVGPSVIYPGVRLGDRTMVLPLSVVSESSPGSCILAGSPAQKLRDIDEEYIAEQLRRVEAPPPGPAQA